MRERGLMIAGLAVIAVICGAVTQLPAVHAAVEVLPRAAIDCRNFTQSSSCAFGVADYGGQILGEADFCKMPHHRTVRLEHALESAVVFMTDRPESVVPGNQLMNEVERRSAKRARFHVLPIDCIVVDRDMLELMHELGLRPSPEDDLEPAG